MKKFKPRICKNCGKEYKNKRNNNSKYYREILEKIKKGSKEYQLLCSNCNWIKRYDNNEDNHSEPIIGCCSGYFNPPHKGHIEYLNKAYQLCDKLVVIVNNDKQVKRKGNTPFMDEKERMLIIKNIKCVDEVILSVDKDRTVCKTLEKIKPHLFLKGGDRFAGEIPEKETCEKYNIKIVDGLGKKIQSSSWILEKEKKLQ